MSHEIVLARPNLAKEAPMSKILAPQQMKNLVFSIIGKLVRVAALVVAAVFAVGAGTPEALYTGRRS